MWLILRVEYLSRGVSHARLFYWTICLSCDLLIVRLSCIVWTIHRVVYLSSGSFTVWLVFRILYDAVCLSRVLCIMWLVLPSLLPHCSCIMRFMTFFNWHRAFYCATCLSRRLFTARFIFWEVCLSCGFSFSDLCVTYRPVSIHRALYLSSGFFF